MSMGYSSFGGGDGSITGVQLPGLPPGAVPNNNSGGGQGEGSRGSQAKNIKSRALEDRLQKKIMEREMINIQTNQPADSSAQLRMPITQGQDPNQGMMGGGMPGMPMQGMPMQGMQGMPMQGIPMQGMQGMQGMPMQGMPMQGMPGQGQMMPQSGLDSVFRYIYYWYGIRRSRNAGTRTRNTRARTTWTAWIESEFFF